MVDVVQKVEVRKHICAYDYHASSNRRHFRQQRWHKDGSVVFYGEVKDNQVGIRVAASSKKAVAPEWIAR
jgi:hypothetical protein